MNPQITALFELQRRDRQLTELEHKLGLIPSRIKELDEDLAKLETMLAAERRKCDETRDFQRSQEEQLSDEEQLIRQSKARISQVKTARELSATQREMESARRMVAARSEEIGKLQQGVADAEERITAMHTALSDLRGQADAEKKRLSELEVKLRTRITKLRGSRGDLTGKIAPDVLGSYDRIRRRLGGIAFVAAHRDRCTACKMVIPHQIYVQLRRGDEIPGCESCGRLLYWSGHFPDEQKDDAAEQAKPKSAPARRGAARADKES